MNEERWNRLAVLFSDALERPENEWSAYLGAHCTDEDVRDEVLSMLAAHAGAGALRLERRLISDESESASGGLPPDARLGPYRIVALVGRGGMGEVYRAERADGAYEQTVAIKLLRPDAGTAELIRRFRSERSLLARLSHPNIASILDGGTAPDGRPYVVLRFVDGEPITTYARQLRVDDRLRLFVKVARAVQFAHTRLIVHRDLKPSNILVTAEGEPVLLDFGIAKLLDASSGDVEHTRPGHLLLTLSHAAPEQLRGEPATTSTDVYGLGALLYELLTTERLFVDVASAPGALQRAILESPVPLPSARAANADERRALRGDLDRIVQMALRKEPERRYQSAGSLADDIERHLDGHPVIARPDRWMYRATKFARRHRLGVATAVLLLVAIGAISGREIRQGQRIAAERDRALGAQAAAEDALVFMTRLFQQSDPRVVPGGDTLRVGEFLRLAEQQAGGFAEQPEQQQRVYRMLADVRFSRGDYALAESLVTLARDVGVRKFGADHAEVLKSETLLGGVRRQRFGMAAARPVYESVLERLPRVVGRDHPDVASAYVNLASSVHEPELVGALLDSAVAIRARIGRSDSVEIAGALDQQARERGVRGRFSEAVALDEASLRILEARFPKDHPSRLTVMGNLAIWLSGMGRWDRALPIAEEVLAAARRQTTPGEGLALAYERVALIQANTPEQRSQAEASLRETIRIFRATVASEHDLITNSMRNLAIVVASQGRASAGLALLDSAIGRSREYGREENTAYMTGQRVPMLLRLGRVSEAVRSAETANEFRSRLPRGSTRGADISLWMGMAAMADGRAADAAREWSGADEGFSSWLPPQHPKLAMTRCALGAALARTGRDAEAQALLASGCPGFVSWGLADPSVAGWGRREAERLGVQFAGETSR